MDWSGGVDLYGDPIDPEIADLAFVARLPSGTVVDAETALDVAELFYTRAVDGDTDVELSFLRAADSTTFQGFDSDGDWVVGLVCSACSAKAPLSLVQIELTSP